MNQNKTTITIEKSTVNDATSALVYNTNTLEKFIEKYKEMMSDSIRETAEKDIQDNYDLINYLWEMQHFSRSKSINLSLNDKQISRLFTSLIDAFVHCESEKENIKSQLKSLQKTVKEYERLIEICDILGGKTLEIISHKEDQNNV